MRRDSLGARARGALNVYCERLGRVMVRYAWLWGFTSVRWIGWSIRDFWKEYSMVYPMIVSGKDVEKERVKGVRWFSYCMKGCHLFPVGFHFPLYFDILLCYFIRHHFRCCSLL